MNDLSLELRIAIAAGFVFSLVGFVILRQIYSRIPKRLNKKKYQEKWSTLQSLCRQKESWPQALTGADILLNQALKHRQFKGKTMGERMVSAQRKFSDNDRVWFAHNLLKKLIADPDKTLKESEVKEALVAFRQALRDIGALQDGKQ